MAHDREFQRKRKDTRMPVRDPHGEDQPAARQTEQDFDLRRARDTPSSVPGKTHRQDIPVQTEFSQLSPETPASLLKQGEAYAAALDVFSDRFEIPDAAGTESPTQDNGRSNFRQEVSRRSFVTEDVTDHDTGQYALSSEGSASPSGTDRSGQEHRYRTHQHGNKYQQRFQEAAQAEEQAAQKEKGVDSEPPKTSKLEFTADELPPETKDKKLTHARRKAERTAQKAEQAQNRLPARKKLRMETVSDPETGKAKKHLKFEKEVKSQKAHVKGPVPLRPVKAGANTAIGYAHKKIYEAEDENVGIKAAHRSELVGEAGLRTAYHRHKTAPYRKAAKLQQKSAKANARLAYRQALSDHPELKKHAIARIWQKQKLKRQYAKAAREAGKQAKNAAVATERVSVGIVHAVKRHPVICLVLLLLLLVIFLIMSLFSTFSNIGTGGLGSLAASTYLADDQDINQAELTYTEWETDLQMEIDRVESDRPGYDEYRYNLGAIEHDPHVLMGYLTSAYQGFTYDEVESVLRQLFQEQYTLSFSEETEIRYRTETSVDPETGEETQEEVPYEWRILNVKLTVTPLENLVVSRMNADQKEICEILLQTKGNRQYVKNVFGTNWLPYVTSYYGYRVHPISGEKNYHTGVDIGMPEGTEILAGHDGTVTLAELVPEGLTVHRLVPLYKDWNEVLQHRAEIADGKYIREAIYGLKEPPQEETVEIIRMSEVDTQTVEWLWKPYIPFGKVTIVQGNPGEGKTTFALRLAAACTTGGTLPGMKPLSPFQVIYQTAEDGLGDTVKPRLIEAEADLDRVLVIDEAKRELTLSDERIEKAIVQNGARLIILDPIQAYMGEKTDMNRANEVRPMFRRLADVAERTGCAVILIGHLNKAAGGQSAYRGLGSIDFRAAARSVLLIGRVKREPNVRVIVHDKSSLAPEGKPVAFCLDPETGFEWIGEYDITADELLSGAGGNNATKTEQAERLILDLLADGKELASEDIEKAATEAGISARTVRAAKRNLDGRITSKRIGAAWYHALKK